MRLMLWLWLLASLAPGQVDVRFPPLKTSADRKALEEAGRLEKARRRAAAREVLESHLRDSDHPALWFTLGTLRSRLKDFAGAEAAFRKALEKTPGHATTLRNLAVSLIKQGRGPAAVPFLSRALKYGGMDADLLVWLAALHLELGDVLAAETAYRRALLLDPENPAIRVGLITALRRKSDLEEAVRTGEEALGLFPLHTPLITHLADAHIRKGDYGAATDLLEMLRLLGRCRPAVLQVLGDLHFHARRYREAAEVYGQAHVAGVRDAQTRMRWSLSLAHEKNTARASEVLEALLKDDPKNGLAWFWLGKTRREMGHADRAMEALSKAAGLLEDRGKVFLEIASIHLGKNRLDEAKSAFLDAAKDSALAARAWKGLGDVALKSGHPRLALHNYRHALELDPSDLEIRRALAALEPEQPRP